jgi:hypothetical protein
MPIETFAFVFTGGKTRGCEKDPAIVFVVVVAVVAATAAFGALPKRIPIAVRPVASISDNKALKLISLY